jgi:Mrp family chromosome partitioning ATPase
VSGDEPAISYKLLERGTPVETADGERVGSVARVLDNVREQIFDGIVIDTPAGERFVDAPEVARITAATVTLSIDADEAAQLPAPAKAAPEFQANPRAGRVGRMLGGGWKRR